MVYNDRMNKFLFFTKSSIEDPYKLFEHYGEKLFIYALFLLNNSNDAEDVVQELFLKLAKNPQLLDTVKNIKAYLYTAIKNDSLDLKIKRKKEVLFNECKEEEWIFSNNSHPQEEEIFLKHEIKKLPLEQREVLILKIYQELSFKEISKILGIPLNTASSRYRYALNTLRRKVGEDADEV